jgi:hypothetical protein
MRTFSGTNLDDFRNASRSGRFIERLPHEALSEFESLGVPLKLLVRNPSAYQNLVYG